MIYNFDTIVERRGTGALKYDFHLERKKPPDALPLWVADMDFPVPNEVLETMHSVVEHRIFGYTEPPESYYQAIIDWFGARFGFKFEKRHILKTPGVVFSLAQAVRAFTLPGDGVILQTPVYYPFYDLVRLNGRYIAKNPLIYTHGKYEIDFENFETLAAQKDVKLFLLCSPHNPVGRVWTNGELRRLHEICERHGVQVAADEIHCDFVYPGHKHTCFGTIDPRAIVCTSPAKAFNLAGLQNANLLIQDEAIYAKMRRAVSAAGFSQLNAMGLYACEAAYTHGADWLAQLLVYLRGNIGFTIEYLKQRLPKIRCVNPEGTFLLWLDFSRLGLSASEIDRRMLHGARLWLDGGSIFGPEGEQFQRINIACPRGVLEEALLKLCNEFGGTL